MWARRQTPLTHCPNLDDPVFSLSGEQHSEIDYANNITLCSKRCIDQLLLTSCPIYGKCIGRFLQKEQINPTRVDEG